MRAFNKTLSVVALSAAVLASGVGLAQAHGRNSVADVVDYVQIKDASVTGHEVLDIVNTVSGPKTIYSNASYTLRNLGPRDVSERASTVSDYSTH